MKRFLYSLPIVACALLPLSAAATPTLSPTLDKVLAAPPSGFTAANVSTLKNGHFSAHDYAQSYGTKATEAERLLNQDGFVDGYVMGYIQQSTNHVLLEYVIAFTGGRGAKDMLAYDKRTETSDPHFQHADTVSGIDPYFGVHQTNTSNGTTVLLDAFNFVKGNDEIGVGFISVKDDVLSLAQNQVTAQYKAAPDSTIPPSQWPENLAKPSAAPSSSKGFSPLTTIGIGLVIAALLIGGLATGVLLVLRSRSQRQAAAPAMAAAAAPEQPIMPISAAAPPQPVQMPVAAPLQAIQLSPDHRYWFDGQYWRDTASEIPPYAQRSPDGSMWWDGYNWRPVPQAPMSPVR